MLLQQERDTTIEYGDLNQIVRDEEVHIHPEDAANWKVIDGEPVVITTADKRIDGIARTDDSTPRGVVAMTTLFGELAVQLQMSEDVNPMARVPGLQIEPCRVEAQARL